MLPRQYQACSLTPATACAAGLFLRPRRCFYTQTPVTHKVSTAWEKCGCGSLGRVGDEGWGVCGFASAVWSCELLGTLLWVQLDLQDVFVSEAISSFNVQTHTHTHIYRCLQALVLMAQGYVVNATCVTAQYVRYAESRQVSERREGLSCGLCLISASRQPVPHAFPSLL